MSNPNSGALFGYATREQAAAAWAEILGNDELVIYEVRLGLAAKEPVGFIILQDQTAPLIPDALDPAQR